MAKPSNASDYFQQIISQENSYGYLAGLVAADPPVFETEWLEFKGCERMSDKDIKSYWSEALSGFANTGGGVLIWGLDARKDENTQIDKVTGLSLHPDADFLAHRLKELQVQSVDPSIGGIEIKAFLKPDSKEGFVICFIPEGKAKAHRAEGAGRNYYLRIGTSFVIPPVSVLRSLFSPQASPYLMPSIVVNPRTVDPRTGSPLQFVFCLKNAGTLTAKNISVIIQHPKSLHFGVSESKLIISATILHERIPLTLVSPINPEMSADGFFALHHSEPSSLQDGFIFKIQTSCEDSPVVHWTRQMTHYDYLKNHRLMFTADA